MRECVRVLCTEGLRAPRPGFDSSSLRAGRRQRDGLPQSYEYRHTSKHVRHTDTNDSQIVIARVAEHTRIHAHIHAFTHSRAHTLVVVRSIRTCSSGRPARHSSRIVRLRVAVAAASRPRLLPTHTADRDRKQPQARFWETLVLSVSF